MRLKLWATNHATVGLAESPDILARHGLPCNARYGSSPSRPEERGLVRHTPEFSEGHVLGLASLEAHGSKTPRGIKVSDAESRHRFSAHPAEAQHQQDREIARA